MAVSLEPYGGRFYLQYFGPRLATLHYRAPDVRERFV